jgi:hypothetical protein
MGLYLHIAEDYKYHAKILTIIVANQPNEHEDETFDNLQLYFKGVLSFFFMLTICLLK